MLVSRTASAPASFWERVEGEEGSNGLRSSEGKEDWKPCNRQSENVHPRALKISGGVGRGCFVLIPLPPWEEFSIRWDRKQGKLYWHLLRRLQNSRKRHHAGMPLLTLT